DDLDSMRAAAEMAGLTLAFGYQDIYLPITMQLKRAILDGRLGKVQSGAVHMGWPRGKRYYDRATWAGKFKRGDVWVMDSPANNAMAHYINLPLFLMGPSPLESAQPVAVEAELYRANPTIENFDTISMRVHLEGGATLLVNQTHACIGGSGPITIRGE